MVLKQDFYSFSTVKRILKPKYNLGLKTDIALISIYTIKALRKDTFMRFQIQLVLKIFFPIINVHYKVFDDFHAYILI